MKTRALLAVSIGLAALAVTAPVANAKDVDVRGTATCTAGVKAKIKAGPRNPLQIKTNVQIDDVGTTPRAWTIVVVDGAVTRTVNVMSAGLSNSIDRDVFTPNDAGSESITFTATRAGASCSGTVTVP